MPPGRAAHPSSTAGYRGVLSRRSAARHPPGPGACWAGRMAIQASRNPPARSAIALPSRPQRRERPPFPWLATLAPLVVTGALYALTRSPFVLLFALLSPVMALAATVDSLRHARRGHRRDLSRYRRQHEEALARIAAWHAEERQRLLEATPGSSAILSGDAALTRWRADPAARTVVSIGRGSIRSGLDTAGASDDAELARRAATLADGPVCLDLAAGLGVIGPLPVARSLVRGLVVQLAHAAGPEVLALRGDTAAWAWLSTLPHAAGGGLPHPQVAAGAVPTHAFLVTERAADAPPAAPAPGEALIVLAEDASAIPPSCGALVSVHGIRRCVPLTGEHANVPAVPELVTLAQAETWAREVHDAAGAGGFAPAALPDRIRLAELTQPAPDGGLACAFSHDGRGALQVDLVRSGPHAVVAGTTGSGKSELLVSWVCAMAAVYPPQRVTFLLVDFKGGSAFAPLAALPHTVGVITDLRGAEASRAVESLRCEIRRREELLARQGARDVDTADGAIPRLVVVVDEFAAMLESFPELGSVFVDIGARGRALGMHLIACTQRATGVIRDSLMANCALRLSLRVQSDPDSLALLGTAGAARLPATAPGRCIIARDGEQHLVQVAAAASGEIETIAASHPPGPAPWRPWRDPLPDHVAVERLGSAPDGAVLIGLADDPARAWQGPAAVRPSQEHLAVIGDRGSGKSTLLETVTAGWTGELVRVGTDVEEAWDAIDTLYRALAPSAASTPLLAVLDDADALLARFDGEYRDTLTERLTALLRDGPRSSIAVAITLGRVTAALRPIVSLMPGPVVLRQGSRSDHVLAGAPAHLYDEGAPPGRAVWRGMRLQIATDSRRRVRAAPSAARRARWDDTWAPTRNAGVVSHRPAAMAHALGVDPRHRPRLLGGDVGATLAAATSQPVCWVGDPEQWQQHWQLFSHLHREGEIFVEGCSVAELRGLLHARILPPPLRPGARGWVLRAGGITRATPPAAADTRRAGRRAA